MTEPLRGAGIQFLSAHALFGSDFRLKENRKSYSMPRHPVTCFLSVKRSV